MDYELLTEIIEGLGDDVSWMKEYLTKKKMLKEMDAMKEQYVNAKINDGRNRFIL